MPPEPLRPMTAESGAIATEPLPMPVPKVTAEPEPLSPNMLPPEKHIPETALQPVVTPPASLAGETRPVSALPPVNTPAAKPAEPRARPAAPPASAPSPNEN